MVCRRVAVARVAAVLAVGLLSWLGPRASDGQPVTDAGEVVRPAAVGRMAAAAAAGPALVDGRFSVETVAQLPAYEPVGITWAPDGRMFVWQEDGVVRIVKDGVLLPEPFLDLRPHVNTYNDRGLLGFALDPDFATNGSAYLFYTYEEGDDPASNGPKTGRVTRVQADPANPDRMLPGSEVVILGSIGTPPCSDYPDGADCMGFDADTHAADTLRFAPDGTLYVSAGEGSYWETPHPLSLRAQNLNRYEGKVLRIHTDGSAPADNPFYDGTDSIRSKVYNYGLRNPYRFSVHPDTGEPIIGDVGWTRWEEVNYGRGKNFGWPCYEGEEARAEFAALSPVCAELQRADVTFAALTYGHAEGQAIIAGPVYASTLYPPEYRGRYFFADYAGDWIKHGLLDPASGRITDVRLFASAVGNPVAFELGPDGDLYYVSLPTGEVRRIRYTEAVLPTAVAAATPTSGYSPLDVQFSSAGSDSNDGGPLLYAWDFGDGASSSAASPRHVYTSSTAVTRIARLTVTNSSGTSSSAQVTIVVGSVPPTATITAPLDGSTVSPGQTVTFSADATDPDEVLPDAAFSWRVLLHHDAHVHPLPTTIGRSGSLVIDAHAASGLAYEFVLTVTDSSGLSTTRSVTTPVQTAAASVVRINCGGPDYTDTLGRPWAADVWFNTGLAATFPVPVESPDAALYQSERYDPWPEPELAYRIPVPAGRYRVNLHLAEIWDGAASVGVRVFDVSLEGTLVFDNVDIFAEAGYLKPLVKSAVVEVQDGMLDIQFGHVAENPKVSAIEVLPEPVAPVCGNHVVEAPEQCDDGNTASGDGCSSSCTTETPAVVVARVNAGGPAFTDSLGRAWEADRGFNTGNTATGAYPGVDASLYGTERWDPAGAPGLVYSFPVTAGTYRVSLHFAEIYDGTAFVGGRVFDVRIEGATVLTDLDVFALVGFQEPLVRAFDVSVSDGALTIELLHKIENPKIAGIEIVSAGPPPPVCGNHVVEAPEQCDDGNTVSGDGCSSSCTTETPAVVVARVNAGGAALTDSLGHAWEADRGFNTGSTATGAYPGVDASLYGTERWDPTGAPELVYSFPVTAGTYRVSLHFAEIYDGTAFVGGRVFDVRIEGATVLTDLDVFALVGFQEPLVRTFDVAVSDGALTIELLHKIENPKIAGIEIVRP